MWAMQEGSISLVTRSFARGTDFVILEKKVTELGGVHLIATSMPEDKSEQVQITGRVARQDDPGSYVFILREDKVI